MTDRAKQSKVIDYFSILNLDLKSIVHRLRKMATIIIYNIFPVYFNLEQGGIFLMHQMSIYKILILKLYSNLKLMFQLSHAIHHPSLIKIYFASAYH